MKKRIKKRLSFLLLTLLGFSTACEKQKNGEPPTAMYGTPHVNIWVGGKVTDKTGTPIPGIEVLQQNSPYKALTGDDGSYELPGQLFSIETTADILFTDTDGPSNGGEFAAQSVPVEFTGVARGTKVGGKLETYREQIQLMAKPLDMPAKVTIDISGMDVGTTIQIADVKLPEGVKAAYDNNYAIVSVLMPGGDDAAAE